MEKIATPNALKEEEYICLPTEISTAAIAGNIGVNMRFLILKKCQHAGRSITRERRDERVFFLPQVPRYR